MSRYFIYLSYDGSNYHGWQVQPNGNSVQAELQRALSILLRDDIEVVGAGRTDAGVHAQMMVSHFETEQKFMTEQLSYRLNRILPRDISIDRIIPVTDDMHARFSAVSRTYHYYIHTRKSPFLWRYSCPIHYQLDFDLMNKAGRILTTYYDFGAFCKSHTDVKTTLCQVTEARWEKLDNNQYCFVITANRFLRNMVRAVVGTLIDIGRGKISIEEFKHIVESQKRTEAGESMPGNALFLWNIEYPLLSSRNLNYEIK